MSKNDQNKPLETTQPQAAGPQPTVILANTQPGILGPMTEFPETAAPLNVLAQMLLVEPLPGVNLSRFQREFIAAHVSGCNNTEFCNRSHMAAAIAAAGGYDQAQKLAHDDELLNVLMLMAETVARDSKNSAIPELAQKARALGATNADIHLTVLITSAFCMYNRYVDVAGGPGCDVLGYQQIGEMLNEFGYQH
jgi:hypothetical protein